MAEFDADHDAALANVLHHGAVAQGIEMLADELGGVFDVGKQIGAVVEGLVKKIEAGKGGGAG